jgi:hypothetical protein
LSGMSGRAEKRGRLFLLPPPGELERFKREWLRFKPHDLRKLYHEADRRSGDPRSRDWALIEIIRQRNQEQMRRLLRSMGMDPSSPNVWERAFFLLAHLHHGVGHITVRPQKKNAVKWTGDHDLTLSCEVRKLRTQGLSERDAVERLARDPSKRKLFPYSAHAKSVGSGKQRAAALRARLQKIKKFTIYDALLGGMRSPPSSTEWLLMILDSPLGENQTLSE